MNTKKKKTQEKSEQEKLNELNLVRKREKKGKK